MTVPGPWSVVRGPWRLALLAVWLLLLPASGFAQQGGTHAWDALLGDGRVVSGVPVVLTGERFVLDGERRLEVATADVIRLTSAGQEAPLAAGAAVVLLVNGDRLCIERGSLRISDVELAGKWHRFPAWRPLRVPLETVRGVVLDLPEARDSADRLLAAVREHAGKTDALVLANGDRLACEFRGLDPAEVQLAGALPAVPKTNVRAIAFNPELFSLPPATGLRLLLSLVDGSRLTVTKARMDQQGQLAFEAVFGGALDVPLPRVAAIRVLGGRAEWLGERPLAAYEFQPYLSTRWDLRQNRNVLGGPLRLDGSECPLGLGMHSRAAATYDLDGRYRWFRATIGVDDAAGPRGSVVFAVEIDGRRVFTSPVLRSSDPALVLEPLELAGRQRLTLIVEYGPWGDVQDYANWCDAVIVRSSESAAGR